jgi:very-short-patch-repair endonuclease
MWREQRTVGEADGILKYDVEGKVIRDEKLRHARIEDAGYEIARWIWDEIWNTPNLVVARVLRTFDKAARRFGLPR